MQAACAGAQRAKMTYRTRFHERRRPPRAWRSGSEPRGRPGPATLRPFSGANAVHATDSRCSPKS